MTSHHITVGDIQMHYMEAGSGPLVILLHGFPEFWYGWRHQIPVLSQHYRVVAPDQRGYNLTDKPTGSAQYSIDKLAGDIAGLITALGAESAIVVGHDWGGAVAWALAVLHPQRVRRLAVLNIPHPAEMKRAFYGFNLRQIMRSYYIFFFQLPWLPEWLLGRNLRQLFTNIFKRFNPQGHGLSESEIDLYVAAFNQPGALTGMINYYRAALRHPYDLYTGTKLPMPVLMLWGTHDKALGKELTTNTAHYCADLTLLYDDTSGHFIQHDNPTWVNEQLLLFFEK
jgi:pimeloyl-ACP methyl ester carboxylesterase